MEEFKEGDVVTLKSGSAKMTVYSTMNNTVHVTWFHENKLYKEGFKPTLLSKEK